MRTSSTSPGIAPLTKTGPGQDVADLGPRSVTSRRMVRRVLRGRRSEETTPDASNVRARIRAGRRIFGFVTNVRRKRRSAPVFSAAVKWPTWDSLRGSANQRIFGGRRPAGNPRDGNGGNEHCKGARADGCHGENSPSLAGRVHP